MHCHCSLVYVYPLNSPPDVVEQYRVMFLYQSCSALPLLHDAAGYCRERFVHETSMVLLHNSWKAISGQA